MRFSDMQELPPRLSPEQQAQTRNQILFAAALLQDGAQYDEYTRVVLTDSQIENVHITGDPLVSGTEKQELERRLLWLDTPAAAAFDWADMPNPQVRGKAKIALSSMGLDTIGHVLAYGKKGLLGSGKGLSEQSVNLVNTYIQTNFGYTWQDAPDMDYVAELCRTLGRVPAALVRRFNPQLGDNIFLRRANGSLQAILLMPELYRVPWLIEKWGPKQWDFDVLRRLANQMEAASIACARDFDAACAKLGIQQGTVLA